MLVCALCSSSCNSSRVKPTLFSFLLPQTKMTPSPSTSETGIQDGGDSPTAEASLNQPDNSPSQEEPMHWEGLTTLEPSPAPPRSLCRPSNPPGHLHSPPKRCVPVSLYWKPVTPSPPHSQPSLWSNCRIFSHDTCSHLLTTAESESMGWVQACGLLLCIFESLQVHCGRNPPCCATFPLPLHLLPLALLMPLPNLPNMPNLSFFFCRNVTVFVLLWFSFLESRKLHKVFTRLWRIYTLVCDPGSCGLLASAWPCVMC